MSAPTPATQPSREEDFWRYWGWLMPGIWLLFLIYTVVGVLEADRGTLGTAVGLALILVFAAIYLAGFNMLMGGALCRWKFPGWEWVGFMAMWLCILLQYAVIGGPALNMSPFTLSFAAYIFNVRLAMVVGAATALSVGIFAWWWAPESFWYVLIVMVGVFVICLVMRTLVEADSRATTSKRQLAVVSERERVARDVHDGLGHTLTVVAMKAELAERIMDADPQRARMELADLRNLTRDALDQVRTTVSDLRTTDLPNQLAALSMTLEGAGIDVDVTGDPVGVVNPGLRTALGWVLREAGTNILRHSGATHCTISFGPGSVEIIDDGVGVGDAPSGHGRRGMTERLAAVGAALSIEDAPQRGTRVAVTW